MQFETNIDCNLALSVYRIKALIHKWFTETVTIKCYLFKVISKTGFSYAWVLQATLKCSNTKKHQLIDLVFGFNVILIFNNTHGIIV